jgi:hypothetical protein
VRRALRSDPAVRHGFAGAIAMAALILGLMLMMAVTGANARPLPQALKVCSAYSREHFHGVTAHLPDGTKCLEPGEYCSHGRGFASAYREYGFICESNGRLEEL